MQNNRSLSLEFKIYGTLTLVFLLVLFVAVTLTAKSERHLATSIVEQQTLHTAESYFDSINVLMISGTMNQRTTLQEKMLDKPGITEARIIRSDGISKLFGKGLPGEQPMDELDKRALKGEEIIQDSELDGNTVITVVSPLIASENYRGTNCLTCHQVKEGDILGAVRISYNMQELEAQISDDILQATLVLVVLFAVSLFVTAFIFRRFVISRLKKLRNTIENIEKESDLTQRIKVFKSDEIGQVTEAFNRMLDKFQLGFQKVTESAHHVSRSSTTINENAEETARAVSEQRNGTDMMAAAINEMEATSREVKANAERTAEASDQAAASSKQGTQVTKEAIDVIGRLSEEIRSAAVVIEQLNSNTQQVGSVLDVIKGIAEQTNLLALNAAIEAARAGESGRGFAVVADEVRTLATKTHESAEEIETMIHQLQSGASNAVGVMNNANESAQQSVTQIESAMSSLTEINEHVSEINTLNDLMVNISDDQSKAAEEINSTVLNISNLAENSSTHASETSQLSAELKQLADELDTLVSGFKIDG